jgi:HEPN domain-containing protein
MKRPEEIKIEFTREWIKKAESDLAAAEHLNEGGEAYAYGTTFHAQQAAEKYLKAFLVWHQIEFRKTHDIQELLNLATGVAHELPDILRGAVTLTPYGVEYRYPGDYPDATAEDAAKALAEARCVREEIVSRLPESVIKK